MRPAENIEKLIKNVPVNTSAKRDEEVLEDVLNALEKSNNLQSVAYLPNLWRITMKSKITKLGTAAALFLVIIIGIIELGKPASGASVVFAAAVDSVRNAGTFSCTQIFEVSYEKDGVYGEYLSKQKLMFKEPNWERQEQLTSPWPRYIGEITITNYDTRQRLILRPAEKTATLQDVSSEYYIDDDTDELTLTQLNTRLRDYFLELSTGAVEDLGSVQLDGQPVRLLRSRNDKRIATIWVDPDTNYPVQIELAWTDRDQSPMMFTSIKIDTELDDGLFSLEPPEGYTLSIQKEDVSDYKSKMMTKAKYLGLWCVVYANDNDDQFPNEFADLVTIGVVTEDALNKALASPDNPDGPPVFQYRKPNTVGKDWSTEVILYEMYDEWPQDGVVACFADGHSELIADQNRFEELIK